jgi:hypothetical protein
MSPSKWERAVTDTHIDLAIRDFIAQTEATGLAIAVARRGQMVFCQGYGVQDLDARVPVTPNTLFHLASVVKTMTSTAIHQLCEAGRLELDDPVVAHLPYFRVNDPRSGQITLRQCLTHTSGIAHPDDWGWEQPEFDDGALERHVRTLAERTHQLRLQVDAGTLATTGSARVSVVSGSGTADLTVSGKPADLYDWLRTVTGASLLYTPADSASTPGHLPAAATSRITCSMTAWTSGSWKRFSCPIAWARSFGPTKTASTPSTEAMARACCAACGVSIMTTSARPSLLSRVCAGPPKAPKPAARVL